MLMEMCVKTDLNQIKKMFRETQKILNFFKNAFFSWTALSKGEILAHQGVELALDEEARCRAWALFSLLRRTTRLRRATGGVWVQLVSAAVWILATSVPFLLTGNGGERIKRQSAL